jgi:hypothetical protein
LLDELRDRITHFLAQNRGCVVSTSGATGAWAVPAQYQSRGLEIDCLLPAWSDALYHLERDPHALVIVPDIHSGPSRWLEYRGIAQVNPYAGDERYVAVHFKPERLDLIDEGQGWGARETLDL